jgi:hypothetical protein
MGTEPYQNVRASLFYRDLTASHPTTARHTPTDVIARKLTFGNSVAIPAIAKTKNMRRYRKDSWLPFLDTYRTMCLAPEPQFQRVLEAVRARI